MRYLLFIIFISFAKSSFAQNSKADEKLVLLGKEMYGFGDKKDALEIFIQALEMNPSNVQASYMAGICYLETAQKYLSVKYLIRAYELNTEISDDILYKIALGYQYGSNFEDAIRYYKQYQSVLMQTDKSKKQDELNRVASKIYECQNGIQYYQTPTPHEIIKLKGNINTEYPEYAPAINHNQTEIIFTSRRAGGTSANKDVDNEFFEDIYIAKQENNDWKHVKNIGKTINSASHDASVAFAPDGKTLYLYKPYNGGDIYFSLRLNDTTWSEPQPMPAPINSKYAEPSISISKSGNTIYFSSDRPGGYGGLDIYVSKLENDGKWGKPINLGTIINTNFDDDSPFITYDEKTLYFSSRGHKGMGEYDIYKSAITNNSFSEPENLGFPINSPDNDIYFVIASDNKSAYFASAREGGNGGSDLYFINLHYQEKLKADSIAKAMQTKKEKSKSSPTKQANTRNTKYIPTPALASTISGTTINFKIVDEKEGLPIDAKITIVKLGSSKKEAKEYIADHAGNVSITLEKGYDYAIEIQKEGFLFYSENIDLPKEEDHTKLNKTITLQKIVAGNKIVLKNVFFEHGKYTLADDSKNELDLLYELLVKNQNLRIEVSGHTDNSGSDEINNKISYERARSVSEYLINKGIDKSRLVYKGYGKKRPIASNNTDEGKKLNRRTEFEVIK